MLTIRAARPEDAAAMTAVAFAAKRHWGYDELQIDAWRDGLTVRPEQIAHGAAFIAEIHGEAVGVAVACPSEDRWELEHLWVVPRAMGRGVGRALLDAVCRRLQQAGVRQLRIESDPHAAGFYARIGARRAGAKPAPIAGEPGRVLPVFMVELAPD